ncbi:uncharacterized protein LOC120906662 [Anopheles arabiensis]|uniref:uncharacterized protein LOC120906662 n=1 Tax=Anopheles arabiensis TaxID=7173 RepID=UPI001AAC7A1F|nr:uncharacterized protein LOC120906662 [Anopheles arabiensis]XP_040174440.1 uncharacterized protein LOC120906662 [Anopheles arabiensis]XP_040174441.1 uncharacterized protein LOC120906662 [Anopheles arabiensis]XP_040174442.1 uncharacterized protein LOC120906662 [Anopheles arabiensis]XP_040174443.1 uncharacterized protein LOC120906662 [Anopheles arabiensis]XP_040174444.1 uncharacterized protein LOC120906662 [Anopheles arabiensis]
MNEPCEGPVASMEEEYLDENNTDDERASDEGSIHNEDTDGEEYLEEEYLEGEFLEAEFLEEASLETDPESAKLRDSLRTWFIRNKVARSGSNNLLGILRKASSLSAFSSLPQDVRTLLKAPVNASEQITKVPGGGEMWYQGVKCCFQHYFRDVDVLEDVFELNLSVDGIPIYNRSAIQMWPILMQLHNMPNVPVMVVGIFCGTSKPNDVEPFLRPLVEELNRLHDHKMNFNGKKITVSVKVIIADSPARAFIKLCYYNGVHGCLKCKCCGTSLKTPKKVIFEDTTAPPRTDKEFREEKPSSTGHRRGKTPLTDLKKFDMIKGIATSDLLHLIQLGIVFKFLLGWVEGALAPFKKWCKEDIDEISEELISILLPTEIHRKFRSLNYLHLWKGTEFGSFLHYAGIVGVCRYIVEEIC